MTTPKVDPRIHDLARTIDSIRIARGVSKRQLALKSGVDQSHLGKFFKGQAGLSAEQMINVLTVLQAGLAIDRGDARQLTNAAALVGTVGAHGVVKFFGEVPMPGASTPIGITSSASL